MSDKNRARCGPRGRTRLILWKPYMFSWRTKLENCDDLVSNVAIIGARSVQCVCAELFGA